MEGNYNLGSLIGRTVRINWGPEAGIGRLLEVKKDYMSIYDEKEGTIYYNRAHIKSISIDARDNIDWYEKREEGTSESMDVDSFDELLEALQYRWVRINGGPGKAEGVLGDIFPNRILLIVSNEILVIFKSHIRSIIVGAKKDDKDGKGKDGKGKDDKDDKGKDDKDGKGKDDKGKDRRSKDWDDEDEDWGIKYYFNTNE